MRKNWFRVVAALAVAVTTLVALPLVAGGAEDGRPDGAEAGTPAVEAPERAEGAIGEPPEWDGDGAPPRHFIGVVGNNSIDGSLCVGFDCVAEEAFGADTIRLRENNLRIHFDDTSVVNNFPRRDWRIRINSSANGGAEYFVIEDTTAGFDAFRIDGDSLANALTVDAQGDVGLGLRPAALDLHIRRGDTPAIRLEQDGTSGFTPQTFDVAGNDAGFFVRDATSGSTLPFRIRPGAPSSAIDVNPDGDVGFGVGGSSVDADLHIRDTAGRSRIRFEDTSAATPGEWEIGTANNGDMVWSLVGSGSNEMAIQQDGDLVVSGQVFANGSAIPLDDWFLAHIEELRAGNAALAEQNAALQAQLDGLRAELEALRRLVEVDAG